MYLTVMLGSSECAQALLIQEGSFLALERVGAAPQAQEEEQQNHNDLPV